MAKTYGASEFKSRCLQLLDRVKEKGEEYIITKHGEPVAKVGPVADKKAKPLRGLHKGLVEIRGDIVNVTFEDDWESLKE
ncbi:MAG: type II toxin-antitoxin system Phd/YefM family antitoxin [Acidobacteriota bacterium]